MTEYHAYIATRPLSWWREYMRGAYSVYAGLVRRPLTKQDKRRLWTRLKANYRTLGVGSYTALAIMENAFGER